VKFYWFDDILFDNSGGTSLKVEPRVTSVPEPPIWTLFAVAALPLLDSMRRHRHSNTA